jgi:hypothetical protein
LVEVNGWRAKSGWWMVLLNSLNRLGRWRWGAKVPADLWNVQIWDDPDQKVGLPNRMRMQPSGKLSCTRSNKDAKRCF